MPNFKGTTSWAHDSTHSVFPQPPHACVCPAVFTAGTGGEDDPREQRESITEQSRGELRGSSPGTHRNASFSPLLIFQALRLSPFPTWLPTPRTSPRIMKAPWSSDSSPSPAAVLLSLIFLIRQINSYTPALPSSWCEREHRFL